MKGSRFSVYKTFVLNLCLLQKCISNKLFSWVVSQSPLLQVSSMTGKSYRKINFPLQVWNLISSSKTEEVSIAPNSQQEGIMECGVACNIKSDCGGFLYDKTSGECTMKSVKNICISIELFWFVLSNVFLHQFLCLLKLTTSSDVQSSVGVYVKTERFAPCLGLGKLGKKRSR